ncbi:hypothetical protein MRX96_026699 [Rhipicephalus microplus]
MNCAPIVEPLARILASKDNKTSVLPWNDTAKDAIIQIKGTLANAAFLVHPDSMASLALMSDMSRTAKGA